jgi:hypothetical protein
MANRLGNKEESLAEDEGELDKLSNIEIMVRNFQLFMGKGIITEFIR